MRDDEYREWRFPPAKVERPKRRGFPMTALVALVFVSYLVGYLLWRVFA